MAIFKGTAYSLEFADGFPPGSSVTIIDSGGIIATHFLDLVTSLSATQSCETLPLTAGWPRLPEGLASCRIL